MYVMIYVCLDIWYDIFTFSDFKTKLKILQLSDNHYNYGYGIEVITKDISWELTDDILKQIKYKKLKILDASGYNSKITDEGIKHMQLHTLNATGNSKITDEGQRDLLKNLVF